MRDIDPFLDGLGKPFESAYLSSTPPEIGIFMLNRSATYPK